MKIRPLVLAFIALIMVPVAVQALSSQQAQLGITILINVTPNPLGYNQSHSATGDVIVARARLRGASPALERAFEAQSLQFLPESPGAITVAQAQKSVRVDAEVTPNPTGTLLTTNAPGSTVIVNAEAGIEVAYQCVYQVTVDTTVKAWQIKEGLATNFFNGSLSFPGGDVRNNTYVASAAAPPVPPLPTMSPIPTSTPFTVYATNGGVWTQFGTSWSGTETFCVDLVLNIPIATPGGVYGSNAIYTLFY